MPKRKIIIWTAVGLAAVIGIVYFAFFRKPKVQYVTFEAKKGKLTQSVSVTGNLVANDDISLNFELNGRIRDIEVKVGDRVAKGDVLAVLDDKGLQLAVDRARANLEKVRAEAGATSDTIRTAEVAVENAEKALRNTKRLNSANIEAADQAERDAKKKLEDSRDYYNQVKSDEGEGSAAAKLAKLTLDAAEAGYNNAKKALNVAEQTADLAETNAENALKSAQANLDAAKSKFVIASHSANVRSFEAQYEEALNNLDKTVLRAPANGVIKKVNGKIGEVLGSPRSSGLPSTAFAEMISYDFVLEAPVPESDISKIQVGQTANVTFDAIPDSQFSAHVASIEPSATIVQDVVDFLVKLVMDKSDSRLKDGVSADVEVVTSQKADVLFIPQRAVKDKDGKKVVQILLSGKPVDRAVELGLTGNEGMVEILSGLSEGDLVITGTK